MGEVHCWADYGECLADTCGVQSETYLDYLTELAMNPKRTGATCMLSDGHDGPHEWTPDSTIAVKFAPTPQPGSEVDRG